ncbi:LysR family transcriptional regulator [Neobacillus kokaensis]|uniref:HTH-type transcriptional regulator YwbI n=1 Tax=Neobacillus kokaensis TaxID=2759023 RepID=A0ABQ3N6W6_9BACI|nr:LysR family transcriptional regulator [Neobacillus kokaensis]GHH99267.1 putative HTH-type transcriptional regulator YwbI [Neobacillus kokaensis]
MELRQLRVFMEVAKYKSMTKAAESLHISQPALSKSIMTLEEELGMKLLIRTNKTSDVTDAGKVVLEYAQKMNVLMDEMSTTLNDMTNLKRGQINIGLPPIIGSLFFPKVMAKFHHAYPNVELNITEYGGARVVKSVEEGEFELGVAVMPIDEQEFQVYPIVEEEMKLLVYKDHPLADRKLVDLKDLKEEEFIFYHEEFALNKIMKKHCIAAGFEPKILFKSSQWDLMTEMVAANLGVTILPDSICNRAANSDIKIINLQQEIMWSLAVITKKERYISNAGRTFLDFILKDPL